MASEAETRLQKQIDGLTAQLNAARADIRKLHRLITHPSARTYFQRLDKIADAAVIDPGHKHSKLWASDGFPEAVTVDTIGNVIIGETSVGTSSTKVLGIGSGTAPVTSPIDMAQMWVLDLNGAGTAGFKIRNEDGVERTIVGAPTPAIGDILYASAINTWSLLPDVVVGSYFRSGGIGVAPLWSTLILPNAATAYRLLVATGANTIGELAAVGATGEYLKGNTGAIPSWTPLGDVAVLHALATAANDFVVASGVGAFVKKTLAQTKTILGVDGLGTYAIGDILYASSASVLSRLADVVTGKYLRSGGVGVAPLWSTLILPNTAMAYCLLVATGANTIGELAAVGATGEYLKGNTGAIPSWATLNQAAVAGLTTADGPTFAHLHISDLAAIYTAAESWIGPSSTAGIYFKGGLVGIGTTGPLTPLQVYSASVTSGQAPASSGTTPVNPMGRFNNNRGISLDIGGQVNSPFGVWLQVADTAALGTVYPLFLNPNGGNVGIGTIVFGTSADKVMGLGAGTAPNTAPADMAQLWVQDVNAAVGYAGLHKRTETTNQVEVVPGVIIKTDTGSPANPYEGLMEINTFDNKIRMYGDAGWRELATW